MIKAKVSVILKCYRSMVSQYLQNRILYWHTYIVGYCIVRALPIPLPTIYVLPLQCKKTARVNNFNNNNFNK